jgi:hypothetical protein
MEKLEANYWIGMIVRYLEIFWCFHPVGSRVNVHITEGYYVKIQHYATNAYYCVLSTNGSPIMAKTINWPRRSQPCQHTI